MITPLPLRPVLHARETAQSFFSRMAAMNGLPPTEFALDMGLTFRRVVESDDHAMDTLASLGGLTSSSKREMISWSGKRLGGVKMNFRGETFGSRSLRNPIVRGCPICLRGDVAASERSNIQAMVMRGDWLLRNVNLCIQHEHPLVDLWKFDSPTNRYDVGARLTEIADDILCGKFDKTRLDPTSYDRWLDRRLEGGSDPTWLSDHSLYAAVECSELLGVELVQSTLNPDAHLTVDPSTARASGFEVLSRGPQAFRQALDQLAILADGHLAEPKKAFGQLYANLSRAYKNDKAFSPFKDILRECILDTWPVARGTDLLGQRIATRRLHSLLSASREARVGVQLLSRILIRAGAISICDERPNARLTFDAPKYAPLLAEIPTLIGSTTMRKAMGATASQFHSLVEDGILVPAIDIPNIQSPWRRADGTALVASLTAHAVAIAPYDPAWINIQQAKLHSGLSVGEIVNAIRHTHLSVGQYVGQSGYSAICVSATEVDQRAQRAGEKKFTADITAAAFGRQVGMRNSGFFLAFVAAGHTPATRRMNFKTHKEHCFMTESDIVAFHTKFMTLPTMATEFGEHRRTLLKRMRDAGVQPYVPNGEYYGFIYLRRDVEAALLSRRSSIRSSTNLLPK
jgi:hypothetical protein